MRPKTSTAKSHESSVVSHRPPKRVFKLIGAMGAAVVGLILIWAVVRVSVADALLEASPEAAGAVSPWHPGAVLTDLDAVLSSETEIGAEWKTAAMRALSRSPLAEEPLLLAAQAAQAQGDWARADRLIWTAHRRNPRSRYALILLLDRQVRQGRMEDAAGTMVILGRLMPSASTLLARQMALMIQTPETRAAVLRVIEGDPRIRGVMLEQLARQGADPAIILRLAGPGLHDHSGEAGRWQEIMLNGVIARGEVARARRIWGQLVGPPGRAAGVFDPDFRGVAAPPPFNWHFEPTPQGFAEITRTAPGLYAEYYAQANVQLGGQLITLPPGRYRLSFVAHGVADGTGGQLAWTMTCQAGDRQIGNLPLVGVGDVPKRIAGEFTVPQDCPAQWLRLTGRSAEFPRNQQATITELRVAPVRRP